MEFKNNNSFNPNMNSYFTPTLFDSNKSNSALHNKDKLDKPDWMYSTQYNSYLQSYDQKFQNNFNSSQSWRGFTSSGSNFQLPYLQFSQYSFSNFSSYTPFSEPLSEEQFELKKSMEVIQAMIESQ